MPFKIGRKPEMDGIGQKLEARGLSAPAEICSTVRALCRLPFVPHVPFPVTLAFLHVISGIFRFCPLCHRASLPGVRGGNPVSAGISAGLRISAVSPALFLRSRNAGPASERWAEERLSGGTKQRVREQKSHFPALLKASIPNRR